MRKYEEQIWLLIHGKMHTVMLCEWNPLDHGWEVIDDRMKLLWFDGPSMPDNLKYNVASESDVDDDDSEGSESEDENGSS